MYLEKYESENAGVVVGVTQEEMALVLKGTSRGGDLAPAGLSGVGIVFTAPTWGFGGRPKLKRAAHEAAGRLRTTAGCQRFLFVGLSAANWQQWLKLPYMECKNITSRESLFFLEPTVMREYKVGPLDQPAIDLMLVAAPERAELTAKIAKAAGSRLIQVSGGEDEQIVLATE